MLDDAATDWPMVDENEIDNADEPIGYWLMFDSSLGFALVHVIGRRARTIDLAGEKSHVELIPVFSRRARKKNGVAAEFFAAVQLV